MESHFSLVFGEGESQEEIFLPNYYGFNPFAHLPEPRVAKQQMLEGVNYQDSGCYWSDKEISFSGVNMDDATYQKLKRYYLLNGDRQPFIFRSYLVNPSDEWKVLWKLLRVVPVEIKPGTKLGWTIELYIQGKVEADGTVTP